jgi:hypothetical protein
MARRQVGMSTIGVGQWRQSWAQLGRNLLRPKTSARGMQGQQIQRDFGGNVWESKTMRIGISRT